MSIRQCSPAGGVTMSDAPPTVALSVRQPWAWLILYGGKNVENRRWATYFRGRVWLHAGKACTRAEYEAAREFAWRAARVAVPSLEELPRGGIVGRMRIVDCVRASASQWFVGPYGLLLRDVAPLAFAPAPSRGRLGFFRPTDLE